MASREARRDVTLIAVRLRRTRARLAAIGLLAGCVGAITEAPDSAPGRGVDGPGAGVDGPGAGVDGPGPADAAGARLDARIDASIDARTTFADAPSNPILDGPLVVSSNPRYFADRHGRALILGGSHTWNDLQDWGTGGSIQPFDFDAYTSFLVAHGHNFTLLWRTELPKFCALPTTETNPPDFASSSQPWARTGPGTASDGGPKFDLAQFDPSHFDRLRSRVAKLNAAGIWVGVYLFTGEWLSAFRCAGDGYPLTGGNNVNGIDAGTGHGSMTMTAPNDITAIQDAMVDKTIDTLNDLPNVLWIVSEEAAADTTWWQGHMIAHVRAYESAKPMQHPIGLGAIAGAPDSTIYNSDADWVAPFAQISPTMTCGTGTPQCKVNINDSDHSYFGLWNDTAQANRAYAWKNFLGGNQVIFMDPYVVYYPRQNRNNCTSPTNGICSAPDARWNNFRDNLGYIVSYSRRLNLNAAQPHPSLSSTGYCLGQTAAVGTELLIYNPDAGPITVDLTSAANRTMSYEWLDPVNGQVAGTGTVAGGSSAQSFPAPASLTSDAVLYIVDSAGHAGAR